MCHYLAFHSWDPYFKVVVEGTFNMENTFGMEDTYELDRLIGASPASASVLDIIAASASKTAFLEEIAATPATTAGAEDTSDDGLSIANHLCEGSLMDQGPSARFQGCQVAQGVTPSTRQNLIVFNNFVLRLLCIRPRKAYLSPALWHIWLEQEGLPAAEMEAKDMAKDLGGEADKEAAMRRAMEKWKKMSVEEKAVWRARADAKEDANSNQK